MGSLLPNLSSSLLPQTSKSSKDKPFHQTPLQISSKRTISPLLLSSSSYPVTKLETPPTVRTSQDSNGPAGDGQRNDFYINVGLAVRTLRETCHCCFQGPQLRHLQAQQWLSKDYEAYAVWEEQHILDDITFIDPLNTFTGIEKYKLIFWALRFHGRILFREISLEIFRVWQPSENIILIRWNLKGVPRVPWEAKEGQFQGTSRYKLDRNGKIYEHKVDNLAFNFPQRLVSATSVLDLVTAQPASPNPTFSWGHSSDYSSSWLEFYRAVRRTLDAEDYLVGQECLVTCS
ncbi:hypothetical protein Syun_010512 [Stephania yunnanensis]|uniref:Uncharacterized protein n=1 Tax=Stephania yunnanensis TaxID=152371 RepID=A0AAP0KGN0_9MAGN